MTYLFKLARRISRFRPVMAIALLAIAACSKPQQSDYLGPNPNPPPPSVQSLRVEPQISSARSGTETQFTVAGFTATGTQLPVTVDWLATGGNILPDGRFIADATGTFTVTARLRGHATIADSAKVSVWQNVNQIVAVLVFPDSAIVDVGDTLQAEAVLKLADGTLAPNAVVTWTASGGTINDAGLFLAAAPGSYTISAQSPNGLHGSATVLVRAKQRILRSLAVSPSIIRVVPGQAAAFISSASWSDGSSGPADVVWSAGGGAVSSDGVYTAGSSGGNYLVVARYRQGTLADTAHVTVVPPTVARLSIAPGSAALVPGATEQFGSLALLTDSTWRAWPVSWSATSGTITASGLYTAGATSGTFQVIATAVGVPIADTVPVTVAQPPATLVSVSLNPSSAIVPIGQTRQFSVVASWSNGSGAIPPLTWTATGGSISTNGLYTAGNAPGTYAVVAAAPGGKADTSTVTIAAPILAQIDLSPATASVPAGQTLQFSVSGVLSNGAPSTPVVTWTVSGGTMNSAGLFTAGNSPGTYAIVATVPGGTLADTSLVTITVPAPLLTSLVVTPASRALAPGASGEFNVIGTWSDGTIGTPAVAWSVTGGTMTGNRYFAGTVGGNYRVIAQEVGGTHADTSTVTITSPVTLTGLLISPNPATLTVGVAGQFTVRATWSNGTTSVPPLIWTATGGTVSGTGLYTAGTNPGSYWVFARHAAGTLVDSASVTVVAGTPPPATLVNLSITPKPVSLAPAATAQFTATAVWSDGTSTLPSLTWTATGGTISNSGLYNAGSTAGSYQVISTGGGLADTSVVTITAAPPPTLTAIVLTPSSASLLTGASQQFTASGQYSNGSTGTVSVTWSATGGVVSATGLYSAGMSAGTYSVIAAQQGGTKADTAVITLSAPLPPPPPPPPGSLYPNEPGGMTWSNLRDFNAKVENGWGDRGDATFSIVSDPTAPSAPTVGQAKYAVGLPSGSGPINTWIVLPAGMRTLYVSFWIKMSPNWTATSQATKVIFFDIGAAGSTKRVYSALRGITAMGAEIDFQAILHDATHAISWNGYPNQNTTSAVVGRGQWAKWEIVLTANTPGQYDGTADWWLNGVKVGHYANVGYTTATETGPANTWQAVNWNPTWGGAGAPIAIDQFMWLDSFYVSAKP